jgi:translation elongation factor EF-1alpha
VHKGLLRPGDKIQILPSLIPAQVIKVFDPQMQEIKVAQPGQTVKLLLNSSYPEDQDKGNYLTSRDTDQIVTKEIIAEVSLARLNQDKDLLISPGFKFIFERGFIQCEAVVEEIKKSTITIGTETHEETNPQFVTL